MKIKRTTLIVALAVLCFFADAKVKPVVHYNFGKSGNVTYAVVPDKLKPVTGTVTRQLVDNIAVSGGRRRRNDCEALRKLRP